MNKIIELCDDDELNANACLRVLRMKNTELGTDCWVKQQSFSLQKIV